MSDTPLDIASMSQLLAEVNGRIASVLSRYDMLSRNAAKAKTDIATACEQIAELTARARAAEDDRDAALTEAAAYRAMLEWAREHGMFVYADDVGPVCGTSARNRIINLWGRITTQMPDDFWGPLASAAGIALPEPDATPSWEPPPTTGGCVEWLVEAGATFGHYHPSLPSSPYLAVSVSLPGHGQAWFGGPHCEATLEDWQDACRWVREQQESAKQQQATA